MGVVITLDDIRAYTEVNYIINHLNERYKERVPQKMLKFFNEFKDPNYQVKINPYRPLQEQGLQRYALEIIALLHLKYWCEGEDRKKELYGLMARNQEKLDIQMRQKYSVEKLFDNASATVISNEEDLEQMNFSKPKPVQRYSQYTEQNSDIQDFTDVITGEANSTKNENILPMEKNSKKEGILVRIKQKFLLIFSKNKENKVKNKIK